MRNISFGLIKVKFRIFLYLAILFSLFLTASGTSSASVDPQLSSGGHHSLALKPDGTVWAWGQNNFGQLGNGTTSDSTIPIQVSTVPGKTNNFSGVTAITGGWYYSVALKSEGTVWAWGRNDFGQLGNGTTSDSTVPVQVSNLSGVIAIAGGGFHSLALKQDGTVWAWGRNDFGQLGNGTTSNSTVPVQVSNLSGAFAIAGGGFHCLALKPDGTAWAWGRNDSGQLGNGTTSNSTVPVQVKNLSGVTVIAGGGFHSLGLKSEGTVWAWGRNEFGQLGDGTTSDSTVPVQVFIDLSIETGNIAGVVTDAITGAGINNATVALDDQNKTTTSRIRGQDGVYKFQDVSVGDQTLSVQATGYEAITESITVDEGQPNPKTGKNIFNIALISTVLPTPTPTPGTGNLGGQVTDAETGTGIVGATVSTNTGLSTTTVKNGAYAFRDIAAGDYTLTAFAAGYTSASQSAAVVSGKNTRVDFALTSAGMPTPTPTLPSTPTPIQTPTPGTGNLGGQITDAETGIGIVGATVSADTGLTTTTVKNGIYTFRDIASGDYILTTFATGYDLASQSATVVAGKNTRADFALTPQTTPIPTPTATPSETGNIVGVVTDAETGAGIVGATVSTDTGLTTATIINGAYAFRNIDTGDYMLTASATGYTSDSQSVTVAAGETTRADFELTPGVVLTPTPSASPIPTPLCKAETIAAFPKRLRLQKEESDEETITVLCEGGSPVAGETITWKIKSGKKRITITPDSAVTDANGEARFMITATDRIGDAKIRFEDTSAGLKTIVTVKVIE